MQLHPTTYPTTQTSPPVVSGLDAYSLLVSWPELAGYSNVIYQVFASGSGVPQVTTNNYLIVRGLSPSTTNRYRLSYLLSNGQVSPLSEAGTGSTWGPDNNYDGLPDDWQARYWGPDPTKWPAPGADSDGDGASNLAEFLAGTDPTDPSSVLRTRVGATREGLLVSWNSVPGYIYQLQSSPNLRQWTTTGSPRFAAGVTTSLLVPTAEVTTYYRVIRVR